jgi:hypothetical protein
VVLQLPVTAGLKPRTSGAQTARADFYYRGYVPYLIAPDYSWTYGAISRDALDKLDALAGGDPAPSDAALEPYCAVLFDKLEAAGVMIDAEMENGGPQPGSDPSRLGEPDFIGERFDVYLLGSQPRD